MKTLGLDPVGGLAGDMLLAALIDAGADGDAIRRDLATLPVGGYTLEIVEERRRGFRGRRVIIDVSGDQPARSLPDVLAVLGGGGLTPGALDRATRVFERLADAEAHVHGVERTAIHFHEVGAVDSILDIAGVAIALDSLEVETIGVGPIPLGSGTTTGAHGEFPLPAPATAELLRDWPVRFTGREGEQTTPTGAAIVSALGTPGWPDQPSTMGRTGVGFGTRVSRSGPPNMLRAFLLGPTLEHGLVDVVQATIDDMSAEWMGFLTERLFSAGALDVTTESVGMKKGRPGIKVTALAAVGHADRIAECFFAHSTTLGVRMRRESRRQLARRIDGVPVSVGTVRVKVAIHPDGREWGAPEYEDCRALATEHGRSLREIYQEAESAWRAGERATDSG